MTAIADHPPDCGCQRHRRERERADREAEQWARERGVVLPRERGKGRLSGGHESDRARGGRAKGLGRTASGQGAPILGGEMGPPTGHPLRHFLDDIVVRRQAISESRRALDEEDARLALWERAVTLRFDGDGLDQEAIGRCLGHGRQWVGRLFAEIAAFASSPRVVAALDRRCPWCAALFRPVVQGAIVAGSVVGRRRTFCSARCRLAAWRETKRRRSEWAGQ